MSDFFKAFEQEEKKPQKKTTPRFEDSSQSQEKLSKKEKRLEELHEELFTLEENTTVKKLDLFIKNSKKYKSIFKDGLPEFVSSFFNNVIKNPSINQNIKNKFSKFLEQHKKKDEGAFVEEAYTKHDVKIELDQEDVLNDKIIAINRLEDLSTQKNELLSLLDKQNTVGMNFKIYFTLFNYYLKNNFTDYLVVTDTFMKIAELSKQNPVFLGVGFLRLLLDNLAYYLNYILSILTKDNYEDFEAKLEYLKGIDEELINRVLLEYQFLTLDKNIDTSNKLFRLLNMTRNGDYKNAKLHYESNNIYTENDRATNSIINELGMLAFKNNDFYFAFKLLQQCYFNNFHDNKIYLFITTILIEKDVVDEPFYDVFMATFRSLDDNPFLCESEDPIMEIRRAYFFIQNYNNETAGKILGKIVPCLTYKEFLDAKMDIC